MFMFKLIEIIVVGALFAGANIGAMMNDTSSISKLQHLFC